MRSAHVDVLIVTALKEELDAFRALELDGKGQEGWADARDESGFLYHVREIPNEHGELLRVAAAWAGEMGERAAAGRAVGLIKELDPEFLAMCGICAGQRGKVFLGDVIVADRVFTYDHGKLIAGVEGRDDTFFSDITTYNLDGQWRIDATYFADVFSKKPQLAKPRPPSKEAQRQWLLFALDAHERGQAPAPRDLPDRQARCPDWARCIKELREAGLIEATPGSSRLTDKGRGAVEEERLLDPDGRKLLDQPFQVHVGPIATGNVVREDPELFDRLRRHVRKVLGAEMEASAIGFVAEQLGRRSIIAKAVSDYADHDKDDAFRDFACHASAAFLLAFLRKHVRPDPSRAKARKSKHLLEHGDGEGGGGSDEFLARVEWISQLREPEGTKLTRCPAPSPFGAFLEVSVPEGHFVREFRVAAVDLPISEELLDAFVRHVHASYSRRHPAAVSKLVHIGPSAPQPLLRKANAQRVDLVSFSEYLGLIDFSVYLRQQTAKLEMDRVYPPSLYVAQRARVSIGGQEPTQTEDVLATLLELLESPSPRFALILGDFGTGKTFLLHELARRMGQEGTTLVPVLIEMRSLQKGRTLRQLVAQHFAAADVGRFEMERFLCMLREGQIALLFDGFDELALRVTYDRVMEHFGTLIEAAQGKAKIIITSRTQHFLTDHEVRRELALRAEALPGYRLVKLECFNEEQIGRFLLKRLGNEEAATERLALLRDIRDLLGLSENPRLLGFIADLDAESLQAARSGSGEITSAKLYELLIDRWLQGEHERVNPAGAPKGLSLRQLRSAATELAMLLWGRTDRTISAGELPEGLIAAVNARGEHALDVEIIRHQLGSGSLLVRDEEGRISFVHQSVMEWLVAETAAKAVKETRDAAVLGQREMSDLMVDFFIALAGLQAARSWAEARSASGEDIAKRNALRVLGRVPGSKKVEPEAVAPVKAVRNLESADLRGENLSDFDLRRANLQGANLSGVTLVDADLSEANLRGAQLVRTNLSKTVLRGAELVDADLSGAQLLGADLRGSKLQGAKLRFAKLTRARTDSLQGCDLFGAARPKVTTVEPGLSLASPCLALACSSIDPGLLASGHTDGTLRLWDAVTGKALRVFQAHPSPVRSVAFSPNGALLAAASADQTLSLWNVGTGQLVRILRGHEGPISSVAFHPDGATLASASADRTVRLWSVSTGQGLHVLKGHAHFVRSVAFSPDGLTLASGSADRTIKLWRTSDGTVLRTLWGHVDHVRSVAFSPDGSILASGSADRTVRLWHVGNGECASVLRGHTDSVLAVAFSPKGSILASGSDDRTSILWSVERGTPLRILGRNAGAVSGVTFSPDGETLASGSEDQSITLWSVGQGQPLRVLKGQHASHSNVTFSPDGTLLAAACEQGRQVFWSMGKGRPVRVHGRDSSNDFQCIAFSPIEKSRVVATTEGLGVVRMWDSLTGKDQTTLQSAPFKIFNIAFSPDGKRLACASEDKTVSVWNLEGRGPRTVHQGHTDYVFDVAFNPDGTLLASASADRMVALWRVGQSEPIRMLRGHADQVRSVAFNPDGDTLASASIDRTITLWDVHSGKVRRVLRGHTDGVSGVAFSPDGTLLVSSSLDRTLRVWRAEDGQLLRVLEGHSAQVRGVAFSPNGAVLASTSIDGTVGLWQPSTGVRLATLVHLSDGWVAFRPDGAFKSGGDLAGAFWHSIGLCRFEPGELDSYLPQPLSVPDDQPLLPG